MNLPLTSGAQYLYLDPSRKFVAFNQGLYPSTLQVQSVTEKVSQNALIQLTSANQPAWNANALQGTYSARNNPGSRDPVPPGRPGLVFSGSQYLSYNNLASTFAGAEVPVTVVSVISAASAGGTIWSLASTAGATPKLSLSYASSTLTFSEANGSTSTVTAASNTSVHVITATKTANALTLRVDGAQVSTGALTAGTENFNTFTVGALNSNGSVSSQFNGNLGFLGVYSGSADIYAVETYLLLYFGVIRGPSAGLNQGF